MLIRFNMRNFLSFAEREDGDPQEFSMLSGKVKSKPEHLLTDSHLKLLKFAAIYGSNASGKSNLVKGLSFMRGTVLGGYRPTERDLYCKCASDNAEKPSYFETEIRIGDHYYAYGFELIITRGIFTAEWLFELLPDNKEQLIFKRETSDNQSYELGKVFQNKILHTFMQNYFASFISDRTLLISSFNPDTTKLYKKYPETAVLTQIYEWFKSTLCIISPNELHPGEWPMLMREENLQIITDWLRAFDTGISECVMEQLSLDEVKQRAGQAIFNNIVQKINMGLQAIPEDRQKGAQLIMLVNHKTHLWLFSHEKGELSCSTLRFRHAGNHQEIFSIAEESDGTQRLLELLTVFLSNEPRCFVVDELDRCLHPCLTHRYIQSFFENARDKKLQLIVTTHESRLLDLKFLRRDEIWFVQKNQQGESSIYSLDEYNERFDKKIDRAYLDGRYGGIPLFTPFFPYNGENGE